MEENKEQVIKWHKTVDNDLPEEGGYLLVQIKRKI